MISKFIGGSAVDERAVLTLDDFSLSLSLHEPLTSIYIPQETLDKTQIATIICRVLCKMVEKRDCVLGTGSCN